MYTEIDDNDLNYFIYFHLRVIRDSIEEFFNTIKRKQKDLNFLEKKLYKFEDINYRQKEILTEAIRDSNKLYTIKIVQNKFRIVYQTARTDLFDLARKGIMKKYKSGKALYFMLDKEKIS